MTLLTPGGPDHGEWLLSSDVAGGAAGLQRRWRCVSWRISEKIMPNQVSYVDISMLYYISLSNPKSIYMLYTSLMYICFLMYQLARISEASLEQTKKKKTTPGPSMDLE